MSASATTVATAQVELLLDPSKFRSQLENELRQTSSRSVSASSSKAAIAEDAKVSKAKSDEAKRYHAEEMARIKAEAAHRLGTETALAKAKLATIEMGKKAQASALNTEKEALKVKGKLIDEEIAKRKAAQLTEEMRIRALDTAGTNMLTEQNKTLEKNKVIQQGMIAQDQKHAQALELVNAKLEAAVRKRMALSALKMSAQDSSIDPLRDAIRKGTAAAITFGRFIRAIHSEGMIGLRMAGYASLGIIAAFLKSGSVNAHIFNDKLMGLRSAFARVGEEMLNTNIMGRNMYSWISQITNWLNNLPTDKIQAFTRGFIATAATLGFLQVLRFIMRAGGEVGHMIERIWNMAAGGATKAVLATKAETAAMNELTVAATRAGTAVGAALGMGAMGSASGGSARGGSAGKSAGSATSSAVGTAVGVATAVKMGEWAIGGAESVTSGTKVVGSALWKAGSTLVRGLSWIALIMTAIDLITNFVPSLSGDTTRTMNDDITEWFGNIWKWIKGLFWNVMPNLTPDLSLDARKQQYLRENAFQRTSETFAMREKLASSEVGGKFNIERNMKAAEAFGAAISNINSEIAGVESQNNALIESGNGKVQARLKAYASQLNILRNIRGAIENNQRAELLKGTDYDFYTEQIKEGEIARKQAQQELDSFTAGKAMTAEERDKELESPAYKRVEERLKNIIDRVSEYKNKRNEILKSIAEERIRLEDKAKREKEMQDEIAKAVSDKGKALREVDNEAMDRIRELSETKVSLGRSSLEDLPNAIAESGVAALEKMKDIEKINREAQKRKDEINAPDSSQNERIAELTKRLDEFKTEKTRDERLNTLMSNIDRELTKIGTVLAQPAS